MFLSNASVTRPIAISCLIIALSLLGMNAYRNLSLELLPKVDYPYVTVSMVYPGATPADIEVDVVKRIEDAVASTDGLKHMSSTCLDNLGVVTMEFTLETDVDVAANDVREKIDAILNDFPANAENPIISKVDVNAMPILKLAFTGDLPIEELYDFVDQELSDRLSAIQGVAEVGLIGGAEREIHVLLDREKIAAAGLSSMDVSNALSFGVLTVPAGRVRGDGQEYSVRYDAEYDYFKDIGDLQVVGKDGAKRYIRDLGQVALASDEIRQATFINGRPAIGIQVIKRSDANTVHVVENVRRQLEEIRAHLPGDTEIIWVSDEGEYVEATVDSTTSNIIDGVILTALILFLFLFNPRSTLVVAVSIPLTIIISLFFMQLSNYTLNTATMLALGLSVGTLVTNSIVVMESISSHLDAGKSSWVAAKDGTGEVAVAVIASASTNMVVLLPIGLMGSMVGMVFSPFAMTTLYANMASLLISFTLAPILCGAILKPTGEKSVLTKIGRMANRRMDWCADILVVWLRKIANHRWIIVIILLFLILVTFQSFTMVGKLGFSLFPDIDKGILNIKMEFPAQNDLASTVMRTKQAESILKQLPHLESIYTDVGKVKASTGGATEGTYLASVQLKFSHKTERSETIFDMINLANEKLAEFPDCIITPSIPNLSGQENIPITMAVKGTNLDELEKVVALLNDIIAKDNRYVLPSTSVRAPREEIRVTPRRAVLADASLRPDQLGMLLRTNLDGVKAAQYRSGARSFDIRVKFAGEAGAQQVEQFRIPLANGENVLLSQYADIAITPAHIIISRYDKYRIAVLYSALDTNFPMGNAINNITEIVNERGIMPPGYTFAFLGQAEMMAEALPEFAQALITALILTYLVLAAVLESFTRPFYILLTVPMAAIGMLWALNIFGMSISAFVLLGAVLLIGIVVNSAVLIIEHMQQLVDKGMRPGNAMLEAVRLEFRAIIMITLAAAFGMLPLAIATGLGSEMSAGIGMSSVGGIIVSGTLTLCLIPLVFLLFNPPQIETTTDRITLIDATSGSLGR